jgi:hypothetical protein
MVGGGGPAAGVRKEVRQSRKHIGVPLRFTLGRQNMQHNQSQAQECTHTNSPPTPPQPPTPQPSNQ